MKSYLYKKIIYQGTNYSPEGNCCVNLKRLFIKIDMPDSQRYLRNMIVKGAKNLRNVKYLRQN